jgi:hypothetical protein
MNKYNIKKDDIWHSTKNGRKVRVFGVFSSSSTIDVGDSYVAWIYLDECPLPGAINPFILHPAVWDIDTFARIFRKEHE